MKREFRIVSDLVVVEVPAEKVEEILETYRRDTNVVRAYPDRQVYFTDTPNDPDFGWLWGMHNTGSNLPWDTGQPGADIRAVDAWDMWVGSPGFPIAVIDSGVDYEHPDLAENMWVNQAELQGVIGVDDDGNGWVDDIHGYDFGNDDGDPMDFMGHGTHVAGTIGAVGDNGLGVVGVNWRCQIVALKIADSDFNIFLSYAVGALEYVVQHNFRVSNHSWGWTCPDGNPDSACFEPDFYEAIQNALADGHILVAAAGNEYGSNNDVAPYYPSAYDLPNIIAVAATDNDDDLASFSNIGPTSVDLGAPGVEIYSTLLESAYGFNEGTSMASPHVTGVVGLVMSRYPHLDWQEVRDRVLDTARPAPALAGLTVTGAVINAAAAVGDCNFNGVSDEQDIADGTSEDCSGNGTPDECEPDCNINGVADSCDIVHGHSEDCNANEVPDGCEPGGLEDCNNNENADLCDIYEGESGDCNGNMVPDECEPGYDVDCNASQTPDFCDIASGLSNDFNSNGIPDECEPVRAFHVDDNAANDPAPGDPTVSDLEENGSLAHPYDAIQEAIDVAISGDEIVVARGVYAGQGNRNLDFGGRLLTLRSSHPHDPTVVADTVIDCEQGGRGFHFHRNETEAAVLNGFTIRNGYAGSNEIPGYARGGGIYCEESNPTIANCVITDSSVDPTLAFWYGGGGIFCNNSSPRIHHCTVARCSTRNHGGGIYCYNNSHPDINNCTVTGNDSLVGGGIACAVGSNPVIRNCRIFGNTSVWAAGISAQGWESGGSGSHPIIRNCTVVGNWAGQTGGIGSNKFSHPTISNCILWDNDQVEPYSQGKGPELSTSWYSSLSVTFSDVAGGREAVDLYGEEAELLWGEGNVDADPLFVDETDHIGAASPCVGAGDPSFVADDSETDFDGDERVQHCRVDMGADESPYFRDCNGTGVPDACEVADGLVLDVNANGVPDSCETCAHSADCDDRVFCNGLNACEDGFCVSGTNPCPMQHCDEERDRCIDCIIDEHCDDRDPCTLDQCLPDGTCAPPGDACAAKISLLATDVNGEPLVGGPQNSVTIHTGDVVTCELYVEGWAPYALHLYQATIDPVQFASGVRGTLSLLDDPDLTAGAFIQESRVDFVFFGLPTITLVGVGYDRVQFGSLLLSDQMPDPQAPRYAGTLVLRASPDAAGVFRIGPGNTTAGMSYFLDSFSRRIEPLVLGSVWIAVAADCNGNGVLDDEDIATGTSRDCNGNVVPDECINLEQDCNNNDVPDECDIRDGSSLDENEDGVPDECRRTIRVDDDGPFDPAPGDPNVSDPAEDGTANHPYDRIQEGIDATVTGDVVQVAQGHYTGEGNRDLDFGGKLIIVRGEGDPAGCVIDPEYQGRGFHFHSGETPAARVEGLTITRGTGEDFGGGGGILCRYSSPTIHRCAIRNCEGPGPAIGCDRSNAIISACVVSFNHASSTSGGGIVCSHGNLTVKNSAIVRNSAVFGGGLYAVGCDLTIHNCTIAYNLQHTGSSRSGSIHIGYGAHATITNSVFWQNADEQGPLQLAAHYASSFDVKYSNVEGGASAVYLVGAGSQLNWGLGNLDADPLLEYPSDYPLPVSPCIDAGDPTFVAEEGETDVAGEERIQHCRVDMGAYETPYFTDCNKNGQADACEITEGKSADCNDNWTPDSCDVASGSSADVNGNGVPDECEAPGDLNGDGVVDLEDHAIFAGCLYGPEDTYPPACTDADLNGDGHIDLEDCAWYQWFYGRAD